MKKVFRKFEVIALACVFVAFLPFTAHSGNAGAFEVGIDGTISTTQFNSARRNIESLTNIRFPSRIRLGTYTSDESGIDIMFNIASDHQGNSDATAIEFKFGLFFQNDSDSPGATGFIEPLVGIQLLSANSFSAEQFLVGFEGGIKMIATSGMVTRVSLSVIRNLESDRITGSTTLGLNFGLGFLTNDR